jgi:hypothetical protein
MLKLSFAAVVVSLIIACEKRAGEFFVASLGLEKDRIIVASQTATVLTVSAYDLDGKLINILADYQAEVNGPRGLALYDSLHILLSLEGADRIDLVSLSGGRDVWTQNSFLTGTIGKMIWNAARRNYFVIEATNAIERFDYTGERIPVTGNAFIQGTLAPCAAPASMRSMAFNNSGDLIVVQSGTTAAFRYTVGPTTASACAATTALPGNANDIINHSNGYMYIASTNNNIYRSSQTLTGTVSIFNNAATIAAPTALAELPNGDLIIASDTTDSLEVIGVDGTYRGTLVKDANTALVHSILVVPGQ